MPVKQSSIVTLNVLEHTIGYPMLFLQPTLKFWTEFKIALIVILLFELSKLPSIEADELSEHGVEESNKMQFVTHPPGLSISENNSWNKGDLSDLIS